VSLVIIVQSHWPASASLVSFEGIAREDVVVEEEAVFFCMD